MWKLIFSRRDKIRTCDLCVPNAALYQTEPRLDVLLPETLKVTARTADGEVMAVEDSEKKIYGVQFHPESILTPQGRQMVENFLKITR